MLFRLIHLNEKYYWMKFHLTEETQHTCLTIQTKSVQLQFEIIAIFMEDDDWFYDDLYDDDNDIIDGDDDDSDDDDDDLWWWWWWWWWW